MVKTRRFLNKKYIQDRGKATWFSSPQNFNNNYANKTVKDYLASQPSYTLNRQVIRKFRRRKIRAFGIDDIWQADILQLPGTQTKRGFQGLKYILTVIDMVSKKAWTRKLTNKSTAQVTKAFQDILSEGRVPRLLNTDYGSEFKSDQFQKMLEKYDVGWYRTYSPIKCAIVERFNRTFMGRLFRYLTHYPPSKRKKIHNLLANVTESYNNSVHSSIDMPPNNVDLDNVHIVLSRLYPEEKHERPFFHRGDMVRIAHDKTLYTKGYKSNFSKDIYTIKQVHLTKPPTYSVEGKRRIYYKQELQLVL